jgi:hypothetical protein
MVYIDNTSPRHDGLMQLMDVHDGQLVQWETDGPFYWYGMGYQNCTLQRIAMPPRYCPGVFHDGFGGCGFREDHTLSVYSSRDLVFWKYEGDALPFDSRPRGIYFRPKIIFDKRTSEYVLWVNFLRQESTTWPLSTPVRSYQNNISTLVSKSTSPLGPFSIGPPPVPMRNLQVGGVGDFALLVDPRDGVSAYVAYDAWDNGHRVRIEKLNDAWSASLPGADATTGDMTEADVEAPILFERRGWFYLIYGSTCCFCAEGGGAIVQVARDPLGPWERLGDGEDLNGWNHATGCGRPVPMQTNFVARLPIASGGIEYLIMGDLWTSAPDGLKSHDLQYWAPLEFDDSISPPTIRPLKWRDGFDIDVSGAAPGAAAPVVGSGPFRTGSALPKIQQNQGLCIRHNEFEPWLFNTIVLGFVALLAGCWFVCRSTCRTTRRHPPVKAMQ